LQKIDAQPDAGGGKRQDSCGVSLDPQILKQRQKNEDVVRRRKSEQKINCESSLRTTFLRIGHSLVDAYGKKRNTIFWA